MAHRHAFEAVDRTLQDITKVPLPFGGKVVVVGGDFRQILPVVRRASAPQIVAASLCRCVMCTAPPCFLHHLALTAAVSAAGHTFGAIHGPSGCAFNLTCVWKCCGAAILPPQHIWQLLLHSFWTWERASCTRTPAAITSPSHQHCCCRACSSPATSSRQCLGTCSSTAVTARTWWTAQCSPRSMTMSTH